MLRSVKHPVISRLLGAELEGDRPRLVLVRGWGHAYRPSCGIRTLEVEQAGPLATELTAIMMQQMIERYPYVSELAAAITHDQDSTVGQGCDDQFEFEFALDLVLDGLGRLRARETSLNAYTRVLAYRHCGRTAVG